MNLTDYIAAKGGTGTLTCPVIAELAEKAGYSAEYLYLVVLGHKAAGHKLCNALEEATAGEFKREDQRPDIFGRRVAEPLQ